MIQQATVISREDSATSNSPQKLRTNESLKQVFSHTMRISEALEIAQKHECTYHEFNMYGSCIGKSKNGIPEKHGTACRNKTRFKKSTASHGEIVDYKGQKWFVAVSRFVKATPRNHHNDQQYLLLVLLPEQE